MTRVRFIRNTVANKRAVMVGEVMDLADDAARNLIAIKKAVAIVGEVKVQQSGQKGKKQPAAGLSTENAGALIPGRRQPEKAGE